MYIKSMSIFVYTYSIEHICIILSSQKSLVFALYFVCLQLETFNQLVCGTCCCCCCLLL